MQPCCLDARILATIREIAWQNTLPRAYRGRRAPPTEAHEQGGIDCVS